jgi:hypothetical protein
VAEHSIPFGGTGGGARPSSPAAPATALAATPSRAISARRWGLVAAPVLAGVLAVVATVADPAPAVDGAELVEAYAAEPGPVQIKSVAFHFSYMLWVAAVFPLVGLLRARGSAIANVAGVLALLGISTMPGFLIVDLVDSASGQVVGAAALAEAEAIMDTMWALPVLVVPGMVGMMLALPVAVLAAARAGIVRWWAVVAVIVGHAAFVGSEVTLPGVLVTLVAFCVLALAFARIPRPVWASGTG